MNNPYDAPKAPVAVASRQRFSLRNAVAAFLAGSFLVPASIFAAFLTLSGSPADRPGNLIFWSTILVASVIGAAIAGRFPRLTMFTAAAIGTATVIAVSILGVVAFMAARAYAAGAV